VLRGVAGHLTADLQAATAAEVVRSALAGAGPSPLLVIDDLDHLDPTSLAALTLLVADGTVRLLGVRCTDRPAPAPVAALWRELGLARIDLDPFTDADLLAMASDRLGGPLDGQLQVALVRIARGSPLLLDEVLAASIAADGIRAVHGLWHLAGPLRLSGELHDRAEAILRALDGEEREAVELVALADRLPLALADAVLDPRVLEHLERRGILRVDADEVSVASPVVASHVGDALARTARRRLASVLADGARSIGAAGPNDPLELRATVWDLDADRHPAAEVLLRGARAAIELGDTALGERLASAANRSGDHTEAVLLASWCANEQGATERAEAIVAAHRPEGDDAIVAVAIRQAEQAVWFRHDADAGRQRLDGAARTVADPWPLAATAQQAVFDLLDGRIDEALAATAPLTEHPEPIIGSTAALARALALVMADRPLDARVVADAALARLEGPMPPLYIDPGVHVISLAFACTGAGALAEADALTTAVYEHALGRPGIQAQGWGALVRADVLLARGQARDALLIALEAEQRWREPGIDGLARWSATVAALAAADLGDRAAAEAAVARAEGFDVVPFRMFEPVLDRARSWVRHLAGDVPGAVDAMCAAATAALDGGRPALAAAAMHDLVRMGAADRAAPFAAQLDDGSPTTSVRRRLVSAACRQDAGALEAIGDELAALGAAGWAVEAWALTVRAAPARAPVLRTRGEAALAGTGFASPLARALADRTDGPNLTPREAEIASLVSLGLSNREIADRLVVSVRTVENHLHRAFAKLGVASRRELQRTTEV
jgi:DNA-binding CsgD family transcriptional regulator